MRSLLILLFATAILAASTSTPADQARFLKDINTYPEEIRGFVFQGELYFRGWDSVTYEQNVWKSDGTPEGTGPLKDRVPGFPAGSHHRANDFTVHPEGTRLIAGDYLYLEVDDELWRTDGTIPGTVFLGELNEVGATEFFPTGNSMSISYQDENGVYNLAVTDGAPGQLTVYQLPEEITDIFEYVVGEKFFFRIPDYSSYVPDPEKGKELYVWQPGQGIQCVKDIVPGPESIYIRFVSEFQGKLLFTTYEDFNQTLWITDGTESGTEVLMDFVPGTYWPPAHPDKYVIADHYILFAVGNTEAGKEFWVSDGTPEGTRLLKDIIPGSWSSEPFEIEVQEDRVYFAATGPEAGRELWTTDGTTSGTMRLVDVRPGPESSEPDNIHAVGDIVYFDALNERGERIQYVYTPDLGTVPTGIERNQERLTVSDSSALYMDRVIGKKAWIYKGTPSEPIPRQSIDFFTPTNSSLACDFAPRWNGKLYFAANDGEHGNELWTSDGTPEGTRMLKDMNPGPESGICQAQQNFALEGQMLILMNGWELWKTDGTTQGTVRIAGPDSHDASGGASFFQNTAYWPGDFCGKLANGKIPFMAETEEHGKELWVTDGTPEGTHLLVDMIEGPDDFLYEFHHEISGVITNDGRLLFTGGPINPSDDTPAYADDLWITDGTPEGTEPFMELPGVYTQNIVYSKTHILFDRGFTSNESDLYSLDRFAEGLVHLGHFNNYPQINYADESMEGVYFQVRANEDWGLWVTDGTLNGTRLVLPGGHIVDRKEIFDQVYFITEGDESSNHLRRLWKSDGTPEGTQQIIFSDPDLSPVLLFYDYNNFFYFLANDGKLHRSRRDSNITEPVTDIVPEGGFLWPRDYYFHEEPRSREFFRAQTAAHGNEYWVLDMAISPEASGWTIY